MSPRTAAFVVGPLGTALAAGLLWASSGPAAAQDLPPDQERTVVFELFTPPVSGGGG